MMTGGNRGSVEKSHSTIDQQQSGDLQKLDKFSSFCFEIEQFESYGAGICCCN